MNRERLKNHYRLYAEGYIMAVMWLMLLILNIYLYLSGQV